MSDKPKPVGHRAIDPDNLLTEHVNFRLARSMLDAINRFASGKDAARWRGSQAVGAAIRELVAWALEGKNK